MSQITDEDPNHKDLLWWGYLHQSGSLHPKRFYSDSAIADAKESDFVIDIWGPEYCESRDDAIDKMVEYFSIYYDFE